MCFRVHTPSKTQGVTIFCILALPRVTLRVTAKVVNCAFKSYCITVPVMNIESALVPVSV